MFFIAVVITYLPVYTTFGYNIAGYSNVIGV